MHDSNSVDAGDSKDLADHPPSRTRIKTCSAIAGGKWHSAASLVRRYVRLRYLGKGLGPASSWAVSARSDRRGAMVPTPCRTSWDFAFAEKSFILANAHDHLRPRARRAVDTTLQCLTKAVFVSWRGAAALGADLADRRPESDAPRARFAYPAAASAPVVTPRKTAAHRRDDAPNSRRTHRRERRETPPPLARSAATSTRGCRRCFPTDPAYSQAAPQKKT